MKSFLKSVFGVLAVVLFFAAPASACVGLPDLDYSVVWQTFEGLATLLVNPDGSGPPVTEARTAEGTVVDATIHLELTNMCPDEGPVESYPREDLWLESQGGGLALCTAGSIADYPTDENGHTQWSQPLKGGGWDESNCQIRVGGVVLLSSLGLTLNFNSPDLNGDLVGNLIDVARFTSDYFSGYAFRSDLHRDGVLNLADIAALAVGYGKTCP